MAIFEKRSIVQVILLTICTLGLYGIYWSVVTKRELNRAGAHVPSSILLFIPLAHFYFWYRYAQGYAAIVKHDHNTSETLAFFGLACLPNIAHVIGASRFVSAELTAFVSVFFKNISNYSTTIFHKSISGLMIVTLIASVFIAIILLVTKIAIFQEGYNDYKG